MASRYWVAAGSVLAVFLLVFGIAEAAGIRLLDDPVAAMRARPGAAAALGLALLAADAALPVPASLVMMANGALFGVVIGALLSMAGSVGAAAVGFGIGRVGGPLLGRMLSDHEREQAERLLSRWGASAIAATRPVPLLAETVAVMAGASRMGWLKLVVGAAAGSLPGAVLYAWAGAVGTSAGGVWAFIGALVVAGALVRIGKRDRPPPLPSRSESGAREENG